MTAPLSFQTLALAGLRAWPEADDETVARRTVIDLDDDDLRALVISQLIDEVSERRYWLSRQAALHAERNDPAAKAERRYQRESRARRMADLDERRRLLATDPAAYEERFGIGAAVERFRQEVRLEFTAELLGITFVQDGATLTFGEATIDQHEKRMHSLMTHATGTLDTYQLHRAAVTALLAHGVARLVDIAEVAA